SVLVNDSDPDGDPLSLVSVISTNGIASIVGTNVVYTPTNSFSGGTTVSYTITDGSGGTNSALITITVTNRSPLAVNDCAPAPTVSPVTLPVLVNGADPDGDPLSLAALLSTNGIASISVTNVIYTPTNSFTGITTVTYTINDGSGGTNSALITITVTN